MVNNAESSTYVPKQNLRVFTQALLSAEVKGNKSEAERITGVSRNLFLWHLRKHPEFKDWFQDQCDKQLASVRANVDQYLLREISKGNVQAIRTYYEMIGKLKSKVELSGRVEGGETAVHVYPEGTHVFQSVKDNGNEQSNESEFVHAGDSAKSPRF